MKKLCPAVAFAFCFGALWLNGQGEETFRPAYQFKEKQKFNYDLDLAYNWGAIKVVSDNQGPTGPVEDANRARYRTNFRQTITGVDNHQATFEIMYTRLKQVTEKGKELYIPGTKTVKKRKLVFTMNPAGKMKMTEEWPTFASLPGGIQFAAELKDFLFRFFPEFPGGDLRAGSTWSREIKGSDFNSNEDLVIDYKILGFEKFQNHRCAKIELKGTLKSEYRIDDPRGEYFAQFRSEGTIKGVCYFAYHKGLPVGFKGNSDKNTVVTSEWVRGDFNGRKQVKELRTRIQLDLKLFSS